MTIEATGFGAGSRDLDEPPQRHPGRARPTPPPSSRPGQPVVLLEANVDDATGETLAHAVAALLDAGAHDAWVTPIVMKKGRPAYTVSALADPPLAGQVARRAASTRPARSACAARRLERWPQARELDEVEVDGLPVRVKVSAGRVKVEHDDAARVAAPTGLPLREVVSLAEEAWRRRFRPAPIDDGDPA